MPANPRKQALQTAQKKQRRGRLYLVIVLIAIIVAAIGWFVYAASLPPGPPDFTLSAPAGITIHAGSSTTATVTVTAINRFDSIVRLSASTTPSTGLTTSISPANITGSGTATLTMSASANGTYTVTVTGMSGGLTHSATPRVDTPVFVTLVTSNGTILVELYRAQAPRTVANFVNLVQSGFYTNLTWHRIVPGFVIQTGDPTTVNGGGDRTTWGQGGSSQKVPLEIDSSLHNNVGYLGMARGSDPNSGSSQFYINLANNNSLDGNYTVFGKVLGNGMSVANKIASVPIYTQQNQTDQRLYNQPITPVFLLSAKIS